MKIYRAMCDEEYKTTNNGRLSWNKRYKWFGTHNFVTTRVMDGKFNNSLFNDKYKHLMEFEIDESMLKLFTKCGHREFMLDIRKANNFKFTMKEIN